jgi:hypothetical protein
LRTDTGKAFRWRTSTQPLIGQQNFRHWQGHRKASTHFQKGEQVSGLSTAVRCAELVKSVIDNLLPEICGKSPLLSGIPQRFVTVIGEDFLCGIDDELLCIHDVPPAPLP